MPRAMFGEIYEELRRELGGGKYERGSFLPPEQELCQQFGCSRMTVRKALSLLANEGLVQAIKGRGVRVIWTPKEHDEKRDAFVVSGLTSFTESARAIGAEPGAKLVLLDHITCTDELSRTTGFPTGSDLTQIVLVRSLDGIPMVCSRHYFLTSEVPGITEEVARSSIFHYIEQDLHIAITVSRRKVTVEPATEEDYELLGEGCAPYLAVVRSATFDAKGEQFEYVTNHYLPDYFHFYDTATRTPLP